MTKLKLLIVSSLFFISAYAETIQLRLAPEPTSADVTAANELAKYFRLIDQSQQTVKIVPDDNAPQKGRVVRLGQSPEAMRAFGVKDWGQLKRDEIMYKVAEDGTLYIAGDRTRGTLYAVYELLEREYGVRFFAPDCKKIPPRKTLELPKVGVCYRYAPVFQSRASAYEILQKGPDDWAAQMRQNGYHKPKSVEFGGHDTLLGWVHTFNKLIPPSKHYTAHPEWFAMVGGKRVKEYGQLCLTNKSMRKELTRRVLELLQRNPAAKFISVSQNDTLKDYCTCSECNAFVEKNGRQSDLLLDCINEVAAEVNKSHPDVFVETLAYNYTVEPPLTVRPLDNVVIRYCSIHSAVFHPIDSETNRNVANEMLAWKDIASQMMVWNYVTDHHRYYQSHPNWHVLADDLRFFRNCGAIGVFEQGAYFAAGPLADLPEMRIYLLSRLMWNPDLDANAIIKEFAEGYYGPGAQAVLNYIDAVTRSVKAHPECRYDSFAPDTDAWLEPPIMAKAWKELYTVARKHENDAVYGQRLAYACMPLTMILLERTDVLKRNPAKRLPELQDVDALKLIEWTADVMEKSKVVYLSEIQYKASDWLAKRPGDFTTPKMPFPNDGERPEGLPEGTEWYGWDIERVSTLGTTADKVAVLPDATACNGSAIRQPNTHNGWYLKMRKLPGGIYDLYIEARCVPKSDAFDGKAFMFGNYPAGPTRDIAAAQVAKPTYQLVKLGRTHLTKAQYVWCAPVINPTLKEFWIDRVIIVPID